MTDVIIPRELFDFLMGVGEIEGTSFGDLNGGRLGRFWWRALLRTAENASPAAFASHRIKAALAMQERAAKVAFDRLHPHPNQSPDDWTEFAQCRAGAAREAADAIRNLEVPE